MIGLVMAGGKGSRMKTNEEKLLLKHVHPTILHVIFALQNSNCFSKIIAATSPNSPTTKEMLQNAGIETFETTGKGYVEDLNLILRLIKDDIFVVSGDLPLLDDVIVKKIVNSHHHDKIWTSYLVTSDFLISLGLKSDFSVRFQNKECHFTGVSIINANEINNLDSVEEIYHILNDKRIAFNLNTVEDYRLLGTS
ncbi:MAG: NTP transferase domain-containing protein [Nitrosopumilaceae archaeon]